MRKGNSIYGIIAVLLLSLGACSLIHDDMEELGYREDGSAYAYVSLTIHTGTAGNVTRANPTGGETGDGYEDGQTYENAVKDLTLFFYPATLGDGGVNRKGNIDFTAKVYIDQMGTSTDGTQPIDKTYTVGPVKVNGLKMNQQYHVLAVANAGNQTNITSLNDLRSATVSTVYRATTSTGGTTSYSDFVMASEGDENPVLEISYENSETNPAETTINLERLVARVDYQVGDNADTDFEIDGRQITASITRAFLVNTYNQGTYVLKRVAEGNTTGQITYLGDESLSNYVIDPKTTSKTIPVANDASSWYDHYFPNLNDENSDEWEQWEQWLIEGDEVKDPDTQEAWLRLGYPKENTSSVDAQGKYYSTGVVFEASYKGIDGVVDGSTFFRYKGTIYPTLEAAMKATYKEAYFQEDQTFETFDVLTQYINSLPGNEDPAGYKDYLKTATVDNFGDGSEWTWENYKYKVLSFDKNEQDEYVIATAKTRKALHDRGYGTETFLNGRGYYIYWIRHNGGDNATPFDETKPMAYGIVRNNVYKLTVNSISKIGDDTPGGNATLDILVAVQNWQALPGDEVEWNN